MNSVPKILKLFFAIVMLAPATAAAPAGTPQIYEYRVEHPTYGNIGTYTDAIARIGEITAVETKLRVAVKMLGLVLHREIADRSEVWRGERLVSFDGVTTTNGTAIKVHGEARGDEFVISSSTLGTITAPASVVPSTPWSVKTTGEGIMMSPKTGRLQTIRVTDGAETVLKINGVPTKVRHYQIIGEKRQDVWLDDHGVPVMFRSVENGETVDFILAR